jgi:hypothetical protein
LGQFLHELLRSLRESARDVLPIVLVIAFFELVVLRRPVPNLGSIIYGTLMVILGLALFIRGLEMALFPIGEGIAQSFVSRGNLLALLLFSFGLGFATTVAEPALIAIAEEAAVVAAGGGAIADSVDSRDNYALELRLTVALSVGVATVIGVIRILKGWPIQYFIIGGYIAVVALTAIAPDGIIGIAYDSGGVTTSTVTVPLVTSLGVGLASSIRGRNPIVDGFGLIAFASLTPIIFVLGYGILT